MFNHMEYKNTSNEFKDIPTRSGKRYECPQTPEIKESSVPTLHSNMYKYKGPSQKEEVMLAVMDHQQNLFILWESIEDCIDPIEP